ncbi:MBOAT family protein [Bosea sp. 2YAB26]|uniref:MBOAT family O-acyltransferase n=1 Tax=Bosea sp. 2YAB26 TaxID=3237478 RepID=UPI003F8F8D8F
MVFSSLVFLFYFLPLFLIFFYAFGRNKYVTLVFSLVFYAWGEPLYIFLLLSSIALNYRLGLFLDKKDEAGARKAWLSIGIAINLGLLILFKYSGFILGNIATLAGKPAGTWQSVVPDLPLGISFYTFHIISYLIDVYRRDVPAERSLRDLTLYISMFPQLVAGPIVRYKFIATELHQPVFTTQRIAAGVRVFVIGLGQKVLIANTIAASTDAIFALPPDQLSASVAWTGIAFYTLQIYYDFGGYSLMAIGLALLIGFTFPLNFNYPYTALSMTDFWRRWHMSLSSWFRDYLYIPLGGNRGSTFQTYRNLLVVFLLCGIWHGASWNFVFWGVLHGLMLVIERAGWGAQLLRLPMILRWSYTMLVVMVAWVFFRADTLPQALAYLKTMAGLGTTFPIAPSPWPYLGTDVLTAIGFALAAMGPWGQAALDRTVVAFRAAWPIVDGVRLAGLVAIFCLVTLSLAGGAYNPFIYFRF